MDTQDFSNEILSDIEKEKIRAFAEDKFLFQAVKKYILAVSLKQGVLESGKEFNSHVNWALQLSMQGTNPKGMPRSDEELGQNLRALTYAVQLVESGFKELSSMKSVKVPESENVNIAE